MLGLCLCLCELKGVHAADSGASGRTVTVTPRTVLETNLKSNKRKFRGWGLEVQDPKSFLQIPGTLTSSYANSKNQLFHKSARLAEEFVLVQEARKGCAIDESLKLPKAEDTQAQSSFGAESGMFI